MQNFYGKMYIMMGFLAASTSLFAMEVTTAEEQETAIIARANNKLRKAQFHLTQQISTKQQEAIINRHLSQQISDEQQEIMIKRYTNLKLEEDCAKIETLKKANLMNFPHKCGMDCTII